MARLIAVASLLLLAACSSPPAATTPDASHPANPNAQSAPVAPADSHAEHHHDQAAPAATAAKYQCPMHPSITSNNPEDRCSICGMKINQPIPSPTQGGSK